MPRFDGRKKDGDPCARSFFVSGLGAVASEMPELNAVGTERFILVDLTFPGSYLIE